MQAVAASFRVSYSPYFPAPVLVSITHQYIALLVIPHTYVYLQSPCSTSLTYILLYSLLLVMVLPDVTLAHASVMSTETAGTCTDYQWSTGQVIHQYAAKARIRD